jgi:hypothetical protein
MFLLHSLTWIGFSNTLLLNSRKYSKLIENRFKTKVIEDYLK